MAAPLQNLADTVLGFLFPDRCVGCGTSGSLLCARCRAALHPYPLDAQTLLRQLARHTRFTGLHGVSVAFVFDGALRDAIHALKYQRVRRMAVPLAELLAQHWQSHPLPADALVPVPLHVRRLQERGFNQSDLLARPLAAHCGLPLLADGLVRQRDTAQQVGLDTRARRANVQQAFVWQRHAPPPARVLLIDDVLTTGATLEACGQGLRAAGTREVYALVLARSDSLSQ